MLAFNRIPVCLLLVACVLPEAAGARIRQSAKVSQARNAAIEFFKKGAKLEEAPQDDSKTEEPEATTADAVSLVKQQVTSGACNVIEGQLKNAATTQVIEKLEPVLQLEECIKLDEALCETGLRSKLGEVLFAAIWKGFWAASATVSGGSSMVVERMLRLGGMFEKAKNVLIPKMGEPLVDPLTDALFQRFKAAGNDTAMFSKDAETEVRAAIKKVPLCDLLGTVMQGNALGGDGNHTSKRAMFGSALKWAGKAAANHWMKGPSVEEGKTTASGM